MIDLVPRMVIVASDARETAYWEAWEEAYIDNEAGVSLHVPMVADCSTCACLSSQSGLQAINIW